METFAALNEYTDYGRKYDIKSRVMLLYYTETINNLINRNNADF